ncbi:MAG: tyrosine-type recombinase/integrase [Planctomycetota bacterium]|jgi:integrase
MACIESRNNKNGKTYRVRLSDGELPNRPRIGFGRITKRQAETAKINVENLIRAKNTGSEIPITVQSWLNGLRDPIRKRLESLGLAEPMKRKVEITLAAWVDGYIESRTDIKPNTKRNMLAARNDLFGFCNTSMSIADFSGYDAEEFRRHLLEVGLAENTIRRRCKRVKQFFAAARRKRLIDENPFDGIPTSTVSNPKRQQFISRVDIQKVLDACPDNEWRLIFALARYGGLRIPSELYGLTWDDILWDKKRFIIHSPKTEHIEGKETRICPLFPELESYLMEAFQQAQPGQKRVINIDLNIGSNLRTQAHRIIKRAGLKPWGKTFQNLRSSRETELVEDFPVHVVTEWLGNSPDIARKHYLQTHEEHFQRAVEKKWPNSGTGGGLNTAALPCTVPQEQNSGFDLTPCFATACDNMQEDTNQDNLYLIPPRGLEPLSHG